MTRLSVEDSVNSERPYERCRHSGPEALSDAELLAVILRTGRQGADAVALAKDVLSLHAGEPGLLSLRKLTLQDLMSVPGIGEVKAIQIICIGEFSRRIAQTKAREKLKFQDPRTIADYYMEGLRHKEKEHLILLMLDTKNQLIADKVMTVGTVNASLISAREIFLEAFHYHAVSIILIHNHPSGDPTPSPDDKHMTDKILKAGRLLEIRLLDHIVVGDGSYFSFCEKGYI